MANEGLPARRKKVIAEILEQLKIAQDEITEQLRSATSADAVRRYARQRAEIARVMAEFEKEAGTTLATGSQDAWDAGVQNIVETLDEVGLAPRIAQGPLLAIEHFLTKRVAEISREAVAKINTELTQQILGVRSMSDTVTKIQQILGDSTRARAMTIAYTEIGRAYSVAQWETGLQKLKLIPGLKKRWLHSGKSHPRPGHVLASEQDPIPYLDPFQIVDLRTGETEPLRFPRDPNASAFNTVNCGCMMEIVMPSAKELFSTPLTHVVKPGGIIEPIDKED